ncbi:cysteine desulfurase family protein [Plantibacter sp. Leaf314]|uniref:cysteine desulfurase family protein n=1 Tax=Plantibacter sp. Leaf314 TaxID=1736333 RepID=UPI0006F66493|nr:cysteine desulfurase family protein [Plantibacter sp. Leaf314]KQQ51497.1 cysteine desulfurase [Plantibacter sp. Leaf314]
MVVYLDHAATTPVRPEVIDAYAAAMATVGNPASIHGPGQQARRLLEEARERIAQTLGCDPIELVFTSGGTESINLALKGLYWHRQRDRRRTAVLAPAGEHHATLDTVEWLERHEAATAVWSPLDHLGAVSLERTAELYAEHGDDVAVATALWANNEVGTIQPAERLAALAAAAGVPFHLDAVSAYGHLPIDLAGLRAASGSTGAGGLVAISVSAHKIGGPVGVGALVVSRAAVVEPLQHGGGQQRGLRSGTQDVAAAIGFAVAAEATERERVAEQQRLLALRDRLTAGVRSAVPEAELTGDPVERLASNVHLVLPGTQGDSMLFLLDLAGVAVSTGSACQAGVPEPSHVLLAMGRSESDARAALRITLGRTTTEDDVDRFLQALPSAYAQASRAGSADRDTALGARP